MEDHHYDMNGSDVDAEGEDDVELDYSIAATPTADAADEEGFTDDEDASGEELDAERDGLEDEDDNEEDFVGAVKLPDGQGDSDEDAMAEDEEDGIEASEDEEEDDDDAFTKNSESAESAAAEQQWEGESDGGEDVQSEVATRNNCVFCGRDEEHDPCEEFEEYMACSVCGDNAHRQCARHAKSLTEENTPEVWRCPGCVNHALEPDEGRDGIARRLSSGSRLTRDLLPAQRGTSRPGSHSVFNTLILDDDPLDGSRSLRKRKASSVEIDARSRDSSKRRKNRSSDDGEALIPRAQSISHDIRKTAAPAGVLIKGDLVIHDGTGEEGNKVSVQTHSARLARPPSRRPKPEPKVSTSCKIIRRTPTSIVLTILCNFAKLKLIQPKPKRRRPPPASTVTAHPRFASQHSTPFYSFNERENDDLKSKPYGGILSEGEADTSKTLPLAADRAKFEEARQKAEDEWKLKAAANEAENEVRGRASQKVSGPPSKIKCINFGGYEIETWYAAPYPEEYSRNRVLYICEFCLKYLNSDYVAWRHKLKCPAKHPPGDEIYRDKSVSVFEVDGRKNPVYCQNLCLLAKLFLGSKTLYYDVEPFLFYIMTEHDELGCHFVGYFSKEKRPSSMNNVSCILTLPIHQRKGYGNLLIDFSYLLTRVERKTGSPEKPLSDMGLVSYRNYWRLVLSYELLNQRDSLSIADISDRTGMTADDIVAALEALRALVRDPVTKTYALRLDYDYFRQCIAGWEAKNYVKLNADALIWTPYIMGRGNLASYDRAPPLPTIAPRDGEDDENKPAFEENGQHQVDSTDATKLESSESQAIGTTLIDHASFVPTRTSGDSQVSIINGNHTSPSKPIPSPPSPIPPTRYEIFPPVSGTVARRRGGWRGGIKKSAATTPSAGLSTRRGLNVEVNGAGRSSPRGGTSPRVGSSLEVGQGMSPRAPGTTRRTRSALDGITVAGDEEEEIAIECKTVVKKYEILGSELEQEAIAIERDRSHKSEDSLDEGDDSGSDTDADVDADAGVDGGGNLNGDEDVYRDANGEKEPEHDADEDADSDEMDDIESEVDAMDE